VTLGVLASAVSALAAAGYAYLVGPLLKGVLTRTPVELAGRSYEPAELARWLPLLVVAVASVKAVAALLQTGLLQKVAQRVMGKLRKDVYSHLLQVPPNYFAQRHSGDVLTRLVSDVGQMEFFVTSALSSYVRDTLQATALLSLCFALNPTLALWTFVVIPGAIFPVMRFAKSVKKVSRQTQASLGQLLSLASEGLQNISVVQAFRAQGWVMGRLEEEEGRYMRAMKRSLFLRGAVSPVVEMMGYVGVALVVGLGARAVYGNPALSTQLLSFLAASLLLYQPLKSLSSTLAVALQGLSAADRLFEVADAPAPPDEGRDAPPLQTNLALSDVRLSYDGQRDVLQGVSMDIRAGQKVALVGASGAGKSSLFKALLYFAPLSGGRILWDGLDFAALRPSSARSRIAWVSQEPFLFSGSVRENVLFGLPSASDEQLWEALRNAHADSFVKAFPRGLEEPVGERGNALSGGQRQRLAIARAFLRRPSLLLLDEPTSALDAESEHAVQLGLAELMRGRTTLVIAHRLSTVRDADYVYVLDEGRVAEAGPPSALAQAGGPFASLLQRPESL
jgi:subfamily B ATP-binding cassette protein MsbA